MKLREIEAFHTRLSVFNDLSDIPRHTVIKGGSRLDKYFARDWYDDGTVSQEFVRPIVARNNNGAGCTFASAIASNLARGESVLTAVEQSKAFVYQAILNSNEYGVFQHDINT